MVKIAFAGTPDFAVPTLAALIDSTHQVVGVWTQPDRPAGRGKKLMASPVKQLALAHDIEVYQPLSLKTEAAQQALTVLNPDVLIVVAYGLILPKAVLDIPAHGCINVHASLLPAWRGAAPIQAAILAGDAQTGVTIMQMDQGLDTGDMLLERVTDIGEQETAGELTERLAVLGADALVDVVNDLSVRQANAQMQDNDRASYAGKIAKQDAEVDWSQPAAVIDRQVRAYHPWPVAYTHFKGERLRLWQAQVVAQTTFAVPGTIVAATPEALCVATGSGVLAVTEVQLPGKRRQAIKDFINAHAEIGQGGVVLT